YGIFFLHKIGSVISIGGLPTTNIIEPKNFWSEFVAEFFPWHNSLLKSIEKSFVTPGDKSL
ncbi:hypothetical protein RLM10_02365, partial [Streptococcus pneumoniae]|nr:hypothetical protein [Streptococcus pneumoniae]